MTITLKKTPPSFRTTIYDNNDGSKRTVTVVPEDGPATYGGNQHAFNFRLEHPDGQVWKERRLLREEQVIEAVNNWVNSKDREYKQAAQRNHQRLRETPLFAGHPSAETPGPAVPVSTIRYTSKNCYTGKEED